MAVPNSPLNPNYNGGTGGSAGGPMTAAELQTLYGFAQVVPDAGGGFVAYQQNPVTQQVEPVARFVRSGDGSLVQEYKAPGSGGQPAQGQYITGPDGRVYYGAPYGDRLREVANLGMKPDWMPISDARTGTSRLFDPNTKQSIDLGQTGFAGLDPREGENARRLEADRLFAYQQARDAEVSARADRDFEASMDLQNRQMGLSAARDLSTLADAKEERRRQVLQGASDFVYRSFTSRGKESPTPYVSHADLINSAAAEFDKIAAIYQQALTPKPISSSGRLVPPSFQPLPSLGAAPSGAPPAGGAGPSQPAAAQPQGIPNWGPLPGGGYGLTGYNQPSSPASAMPAMGSGGGGLASAAPAPALEPTSRLNPASIDWSTLQRQGDYMGRSGEDGGYPSTPGGYAAPAPNLSDYPSWAGDSTKGVIDWWNRMQKVDIKNAPWGNYEDGGRAPADEPYIVGEDGYEIALPQPDGTTAIIPNEIARKLVGKDGSVKKLTYGTGAGKGRLKGFEDGTWGGYGNAGAAISAFNAAQAASGGASLGTGGWSYGGASQAAVGGTTTAQGGSAPTSNYVTGGAMPRDAYNSRLAGVQAAYPGFNFMDYNTAHGLDANGNPIPSLQYGYQPPTTGNPQNANGAPPWLAQLLQTLRPPTTSQDQILADEQRLRPPAVDSILGGTDMPNLNIVGPGNTGSPQLASRLALGKLTPDELLALNTSLGVRYNSTLDDYLAASDQRYLAGAGQRRLRASYR